MAVMRIALTDEQRALKAGVAEISKRYPGEYRQRGALPPFDEPPLEGWRGQSPRSERNSSSVAVMRARGAWRLDALRARH